MRAADPAHSASESLFRALTRTSAQRAPQEPSVQLRRCIVERGLLPGDRLPAESELAEAIGGSRVVVRRALHALEAHGLVESRAGSGWYLRPLDVSNVAQSLANSLAFHPRVVLDLLAIWRPAEAELALQLPQRLSPTDLDTLADLADRMVWRASRGEPFWREDGEFHRRLVAASENPIALALVDLYWGVKEALYAADFPLHSPSDAPLVAQAHSDIVGALRRGKGDDVARLLRDHYGEAERRFGAGPRAESAGEAAGPSSRAMAAMIQAALLGFRSESAA